MLRGYINCEHLIMPHLVPPLLPVKFHCNSSPQWTDICQYWHNTNAILCCQSLEDRVCGCVAM